MKLNLVTACSHVTVHPIALTMHCALWEVRTCPQREKRALHFCIDDWPKGGHAEQTPSDKTVGCKSQCKGGKKGFNSVLKTWASRHFSAEAAPCTIEND